MAQRLVRVLCEECKEEDRSERTRALCERVEGLSGATVYRAVGCKACRMTGYNGRQALFELMPMSIAIRQALLSGASSGDVKTIARREGMRTLVEDGWRIVRDGRTTPAEVLRVSKDEDAQPGEE